MKVRTRREAKLRRHLRLRDKVSGTAERPRLCVHRTLKHIYAQVIDDAAGVTLVSASTLEPTVRTEQGSSANQEAANRIGALVAQRAKEKGIEKVVFDRTGNQYHGRVKSLAEAAREAGLDL